MAPRIYRVQIQGSLEDPFWGGRSKNRPGRIGPVESERRPLETSGRLNQLEPDPFAGAWRWKRKTPGRSRGFSSSPLDQDLAAPSERLAGPPAGLPLQLATGAGGHPDRLLVGRRDEEPVLVGETDHRDEHQLVRPVVRDPNLNDRPHLLDPLTKRPGLARLHPVEVVGVVLANRSQDVHRGPRFHSGVFNLLILIIKGLTAPRNSGSKFSRFFRVARGLPTVAAGRLLRARARFLFRAVPGPHPDFGVVGVTPGF